MAQQNSDRAAVSGEGLGMGLDRQSSSIEDIRPGRSATLLIASSHGAARRSRAAHVVVAGVSVPGYDMMVGGYPE
ncbi:MAG: hypothetical protein M3165_03890 [Actinomycetota bacterium]|nr:hypothetical protein [Actinomycetota bacterium]